jgi:hypothetical protein
MSVRYLFADGNFSSIPAISSAESGQALTVVDGSLAWITPGAGPAGPIQDVLGTSGEIVAVKNDITGIVTVSLPDNILTSAITLAYDSETSNSGYTLPVTTEDIAGNELVAGSKYVMQYAAPVGSAAGVMQFAVASAGSAGVTSITGEDGITASGPSGAVTLTLGAITPDSVTAGSVAVESGANSYILPVPSALTDGAKYVVQYATGGQLSFTEEAAGGGINNITSTASPASGSGIIVDSITDPAAPNLSLGNIKPTSVTIGTAGNVYSLPASNAGLADTGKYVLQYTASGQQFAFTEETAGGAGVQSVTSKNDGTVGSGIVVDNADAANPVLELGNIVPQSVNVKGQFTLPESMTGAQAGYAMLLPTPLPSAGTSAQMIWGPVGGGPGGSGTVTNIVAGSNIEVTGATPTVDPTISVNPIMTGVTSISAGEYTTTPAAVTNKTFINVNNALVVKSGATDVEGTDLYYVDRDSASGFKCVNDVKGFQVITNVDGTVPPSTTPIQIGYILPTVQPTAVGQVLAVQTLQVEPSGGNPNPTFTTTEWIAATGGISGVVTANNKHITTNTAADVVTLDIPTDFDLTLTAAGENPALTQTFKLGDFTVTETKGLATDLTAVLYKDHVSNLGFEANDEGLNIITGESGGDLISYTLPVNQPGIGDIMQCSDTPSATSATCSWVNVPSLLPVTTYSATGVTMIAINSIPGGTPSFAALLNSAFTCNFTFVSGVKFVEINFDDIYTNGGVIYDAAFKCTEIDSSPIDLTAHPQFRSALLTTYPQDMNIGQMQYSTATDTDPKTSTASYGTCTISLRMVDENTIVFRFVLNPNSNGIANAILTDTTPYAFQASSNVSIIFSALMPGLSDGVAGLNLSTPSAKTLFTYY